MNIAFIGDSFCHGVSVASWTNILASKLGANVICRGRGGVSVGQTYFDLMDHLNSADVFFMFYTDQNRLYNPHIYPLNMASCEDYGRNGISRMVSHETKYWPDDGIWSAGHAYFKHIFDYRYHGLMHELIVDRCDAVLAQHIRLHPHKRVYNFHSFPPVNGITGFESGPCAREAMIDMIGRHGKTVYPGDMDENHMDRGLNRAFADAMFDLVNGNPPQWFDLI